MSDSTKIKYLVIAGGGPLGFRYLGALLHLHDIGFWNIDSVEKIYGTSIGAVIGAFFCLKYDSDTLKQYVVDRPWHDAFKITGRQIFDAYYAKGLVDTEIMTTIFKPLLEAKELTTQITLQEFYNFCRIELNIYTCDLNEFKIIPISYKTHPDMLLMRALTMSCALPGLFIPYCNDQQCIVDGGVICNYPLQYCIRDNECSNKNILGVNYAINSSFNNNIKINEKSTLLDFIMAFSINAINFASQTSTNTEVQIKNELVCLVDGQAITLENISTAINSSEMRKKLITDGEADADNFIKNNGN